MNNIHQKSVLHKITEKVPVIPLFYTIGDAQSFIKKHIRDFETIDYIYAVDGEGKLAGVFSAKDLYRFSPGARVSEICKKQIITVGPEAHQEEAAYVALQHGIKSVPVVDKDGKFLGAVPHDAITSILHREMREDILHMAGVHKSHAVYDNVIEAPISQTVKHRLPWLLIGAIGGIFAAKIIGFFEHTLETNLILAAFIPLIVYIADAVGTQSEAFAIRDFALFRKLNFAKYFFRQLAAVFIIAILLGITLGAASFLIHKDLRIILVIGFAVFCATISSLFTGILIPYFFRKLHTDPANASGPIGTIIQDVLSVVIYFAIASVLL